MTVLSFLSDLVGAALGALKFVLLSALKVGKWLWDRAHLR